MNNKIISLIALASGLAAVGARAQTTPLLVANIVEIDVTDNTVGGVHILTAGANYNGVPPTVVFNGGGGAGAAGNADLDTTSMNAVVGVSMTSGGINYVTPPAVTFVGGGPLNATVTPTEATGQAVLNVTTAFIQPKQNEGFGFAGDTIAIFVVATGTDPASGFIFDFTVNGMSIGATTIAVSDGQETGVYWTPALPGIYSIVASTSDGNGNTAVSAPIRYFGVGTVIVAPEAGGTGALLGTGPGSLVPVGSSIYLQATSCSSDGFISKVVFYTDWNGSTGTLIGSATNYPYSVQYTPAGAAGTTHLIKAVGYDNLGHMVPAPVAVPNPNQDEILLTMTTANPAGLPSGTIIAPSTGSLIEIPDYAAQSTAYVPVIVTAGAQDGAQVTKVELYVNGVLYKTDTAYSDGGYPFQWTPQSPGAYALSALIYDSNGNVVPSTSISTTSTTPVAGPANVIIEAAPAIAITNPGGGATISTGGATIQAVAIDTNLDTSGNPIPITQVQFFQDGNFVGSVNTPTSGDLYQISFKPTQNTENGVVVPSLLTAVATDADGFQGTSATVSVTVTSGGSATNNVVIGTPPTVTLTAPAAGSTAVVNIPTTLSASATAPNGNIASVSFLIDNAILKTVTQYPYSVAWTPQNLGTYQVAAQVTDNVGDKTTTPAITVTVITPPSPTVSFSTPSAGSTVNTGTAVTITANASSPAGTIAQVQFFENGISIGTATSAPYTVTFTPPSSGVYTLTAIATDNSGNQTTGAPVVIEAIPTESGLGTTSYFGQYAGLTDGGRFAFIVVDGKFGTYIGHSGGSGAINTAVTNPTIAFYTDLSVSPLGSFATANLSGEASGAGVSGNLLPSDDILIGTATPSGGTTAGYYTGSFAGNPNSSVTAIVGGDGSLMMEINTGSGIDVADGSSDPVAGTFTVTTVNNNQLVGTIDPNTGFMTATFSGAGGGNITAGKVSGGTFSDGVLKNISTRGQVGTGANIMVAGFAVGGSSPKQLLIRAVGPTLATFGLSGTLPSAVLQIYSGTTLVQSNTGWSSTAANQAAITAADSQVGAFALPAGSADSALIGTFAPGTYTAQISGVSGATGLALAEVYDMDTYVPFSAQRLTNVSTRGQVGAGSDVLIGGFSINGTAPKRLLIRGAGPTLSTLAVTGALSAAHLQIYNTSQTLIRENYSWQTGNDSGLVAAAETATGAFNFANKSADAAVLMVLPPGTYTAILSGATTTTTGVGLVEVYEVP